ncbi:hypothetical protein TARUN_9320 [Trichoderma arundinaceum]|uniref:Uncharacterized protein n=1 Tax=Trichoderma arundinaceum TaxID=490622 RepID=A0A395NB65_TRIAR|nr:hypothetical protein TARUN_9320 [Trichoderma arundinaceum]
MTKGINPSIFVIAMNRAASTPTSAEERHLDVHTYHCLRLASSRCRQAELAQMVLCLAGDLVEPGFGCLFAIELAAEGYIRGVSCEDMPWCLYLSCEAAKKLLLRKLRLGGELTAKRIAVETVDSSLQQKVDMPSPARHLIPLSLSVNEAPLPKPPQKRPAKPPIAADGPLNGNPTKAI